MKQCNSCGAKIKDEANFCSSCGSDTFIVKGAVKGKKSKWFIGVAVCVALGIIGVLASENSSSPSTATTASKLTFEYSESQINTASATTEYTNSQLTYTTTQPTSLYTTTASTTSFVAKELPLSADFQYHMNSFLSKYSEADIQSFNRNPGAEQLAEFGVRYTYIHQNENWEKLENPVTIEGNVYNYRIEDRFVSRAITDHFCFMTLIPGFHENKPNHYDGYYYHYEMGGMDMNDLTVVTRVVQVDEREFEVYFNLYDTSANNRNMYSMTNEQVLSEMAQKPYIRYVGTGKAVIESYDIYDGSASRLSEYYIY